MDSGNSGSLQSSSGGGDDDFDSRCGGGVDSSSPLSALLRQSAAGSGSPSVADFGASFYGLQELATPPLPPLSQATHHWPTAIPAGDGVSPSSSSHGVPAAVQPPAPARASRKRTRASRRAPTTVLTTDTSNFRAMVQEFTGIPSPPFVGGAPTRSRFDHLFTSASALRSTAAGHTAASLPPYLLRPFAKKLHPSPLPPFASSTTSSPALSAIAVTPPSAAATTASQGSAVAASGDGYNHQLAPAPSALFGMQDHGGSYLSFQSPLGAQLAGGGVATKYPAQPMFDAAGGGGGGSSSAPLRLHDPADFLGLTHGVMGSDGTHLHRRNRDHAGDELSGLVGAASVTGSGSSGGCKATYPSTAGSARKTPLLERNVESTAAGVAATTTATADMRTQGLDSWVCTSE